MKSIHAIVLISICWLILGIGYYPKWQKSFSEATISWDVSGYYHYLPGIFIYHDLKRQDWMKYINDQYLPSPAYDQSFDHPSGNKVNKYAIGQAVLYSPFFLVAHAYAKLSGKYPADGYSRPYQIAIWLGSFLISILGLILLRRMLLQYFDDRITLWTLLTLGLATNWMEYASIGNGMNHTWLFTLLCGLILASIQFYRKANWTSIIAIGIFLGLSTLTRPTEIIWLSIPLLWGITSLADRLRFLKMHWKKILVAVFICGMIMSIQSVYWHHVSGQWIVYTYGEQGFNWLHPKIWKGLMGVRIGWWIYTPVMLLAMFGWVALYRKHRSVFWPTFITAMLAIYITLSWSHFESGGGLGQRNLIQIYPLMAFPLSMVIAWLSKIRFGYGMWIGLFLMNVYYNGWWIHQAHKGGFFQAGQMNTMYFLKVAGRLHPDHEYLKLLDIQEYFEGEPKNAKVLLENNFDSDTSYMTIPIPNGGRSILLNANHQDYGPLTVPVDADCFPWLRVEADFNNQSHEWDVWKYAQWIVRFYQDDQVIKTNLIRIQRLIPVDQIDTHIFFDVRVPDDHFDKCTMAVWHAGSKETLLLDNLKISCHL